MSFPQKESVSRSCGRSNGLVIFLFVLALFVAIVELFSLHWICAVNQVDVTSGASEEPDTQLSTVPSPTSPISSTTGAANQTKIFPFAQWFEISDPTIMLKGRTPGLVLDVGAHVGWTINKVAKYGHRVIAFEPFPANCKILLKNTKEYQQNITLHCAGVAEKSGWGRLGGMVRSGVTKDGSSSTGKFATGGRPCKKGVGGCTKSYALDDIVKEHVIYMKIDVQGGELNVLKGATNLFDKYGVDAVFLEVLGMKATKPVQWLMDRGYTCLDFPYAHYHGISKGPKGESIGRVKISESFATTGRKITSYVEKERSFEVLHRFKSVRSPYLQNDYLCVKF